MQPGRQPTIVCKQFVDMQLAHDLDVVNVLVDVDTIELLVQNALVAEVKFIFRADDAKKIFDGIATDASDGQIVNLTANRGAYNGPCRCLGINSAHGLSKLNRGKRGQPTDQAAGQDIGQQ